MILAFAFLPKTNRALCLYYVKNTSTELNNMDWNYPLGRSECDGKGCEEAAQC